MEKLVVAEQYQFDWAELAFASKKPIKDLKPIFIAAPREISTKRLTQLIKQHLPQGNIVLGLAKEPYIAGFEHQPQFSVLKLQTIQKLVDKVNNSPSSHKLYTLNYFQRELEPIIEKISFKQVLLINGSWKYAFHNLSVYYLLAKRQIPYSLISPFCDETEAESYVKHVRTAILKSQPAFAKNQQFSETDLIDAASVAAKQSFDYNFQTGVVLAKKVGKKYKLLASSYNKVIPYETYAMHFGASREVNFSPPHDLNHYDTVHAEVELILAALEQKISLRGASVFINLLPCPACARMLCDTDIAEVIYQNDHSDGYAVKLLEKAGKTVRRVVI